MQYGAFPLDPEAPLFELLRVPSFVAVCTQIIRPGTTAPLLAHRNAVLAAKASTPFNGTTARSLPFVLRRFTEGQYRCST